MAKAALFLLVLILWVLLAGTADADGTIYVPLVQGRATHAYYVPVWYAPAPVKLGLSGGTIAQAEVIGAAWLYDWTAHPPVREWFESVPMLGNWFDPEGECPAVGGNSAWLLGANECDLANQCNTPAAAYAPVWRRIEECYPNRRLVSPAPSDSGRNWLVELRLAYRARYGEWPRFDALAMHCYRWTAAGCEPVLQDFLTWVRDWDVPGGLWVTEFAFVPAWASDAESEARAFVATLEAEPLVERYALFTAWTPLGVWYWPGTRPEEDPSLFVGPGSLELTTVGRWYAR